MQDKTDFNEKIIPSNPNITKSIGGNPNILGIIIKVPTPNSSQKNVRNELSRLKVKRTIENTTELTTDNV